jgi:hypothetical protein
LNAYSRVLRSSNLYVATLATPADTHDQVPLGENLWPVS